ncbi:rod shape-determining protein RodA [Rhodospirillum rubrum]|uniref:rod shape-determining protein RodA n=1 Tax=Rhodospirillum rubrum TaxID=1085 RepID=UPI0019062676|nr:rod shape-determining protein RodA [Rhodospirillum rubrum]MBK1663525.1 rod shape-determining protein RodA [Rhodospirillum rubrum]MBK1677301.1 rod shape-determining protein RodA [Rhodospirillum rubrum]
MAKKELLDEPLVTPWHVVASLRIHDILFLLALAFLSLVGALALFSAAGGRADPWADSHLIRFGIGLVAALALACVNVRVIMHAAYAIYGFFLLALVGVAVFGHVGMGAQRWLNLGVVAVQPSEFMKVGLIVALARYYHHLPNDRCTTLLAALPAAFLTLLPVGLVFLQPNLGTSILLAATGGIIALLGGLPLWTLAVVFTAAGVSLPVLWSHMHDYQKARVLTFLNPERDPLGAGYNIIQSKIALGSGGIWGKGLLNGSQSQLGFLPEKHTDFIFVVIAEELGMFGGMLILGACCAIVIYGYIVAARTKYVFGRLCAVGVASSFFLYVFVNLAMVMGLIPVVGIPLPLVSYGGTVMIAVMVSAGLLLNISIRPRLR